MILHLHGLIFFCVFKESDLQMLTLKHYSFYDFVKIEEYEKSFYVWGTSLCLKSNFMLESDFWCSCFLTKPKSDLSYFHIFSKNDKKQKLSPLKEEALVAHLNWTGQLMKIARRCSSQLNPFDFDTVSAWSNLFLRF